jgi:hypothetical protein
MSTTPEEESSVKHHIYDERFRSMSVRMDGFDESFKSIRSEMKDGFNSIFAALDKRSHEPMRFGKEFFSLLTIGVGALWFVITLRVNPLAKNQELQGAALVAAKTALEAQLPLLDYRAEVNRGLIEKNSTQLAALNAKAIDDAKWMGRMEATLERAREDMEAQKKHLNSHGLNMPNPSFKLPD